MRNLESVYRATQQQQVAINRLQRRGLPRDEAIERVVGRKPTLKQDFAAYLQGLKVEETA